MVIQVGQPCLIYRSLKFIQQWQHQGKDEQRSNIYIKVGRTAMAGEAAMEGNGAGPTLFSEGK